VVASLDDMAMVGFSFGFPVDEGIQDIVDLIPGQCWHPAIEEDGLRDGAWVAEATGMIDLSSWPEGSRLILRKERPHPGAQLTFTDVDGHRITAFLTDTPRGVIGHQIAGLELRHRQHARVEDRIREGKQTGLRNLPCRAGRKTAPGWRPCSPPPTWSAGPS
jgi:Transposase DDE domain group 1